MANDSTGKGHECKHHAEQSLTSSDQQVGSDCGGHIPASSARARDHQESQLDGVLQELAKAGQIEHPENYESIGFEGCEIAASSREDRFVAIEDGRVLVGIISSLRGVPEAAELLCAIDTYFLVSECLDVLIAEGRVTVDVVDGECIYECRKPDGRNAGDID